MVEFKVPEPGQDPGDEMVEFLNQNQEDWEGDDSGIMFFKEINGKLYSCEAWPGDIISKDDEGYFAMDANRQRKPWTEM